MDLFEHFKNPPRKYSLVPFWFLNDDLDADELRRQLDDFEAHGVYGVVPHARMGLPESLAFMSDRWLEMLRLIVEHAAARDMQIILYDEGMYPSGSCAGQVVAANPRHATRCIERRPLRHAERLGEDEEEVARDAAFIYVNTRSMGKIRGVHFGTDDGEPNQPPSADILNPEAVASFLHLVHDRHFEILGEHFGKTITAIFTDEPDKLGRGHKRGVQPWTYGLETFLEDYLGYDFRPHLAALWDENYPDRDRYKRDFEHALNARLEASYYKPYHDWCEAHGIALTGHPAGPMDIGTLKYFHIPGQDVVWRYLEPFQDKSLEEAQSTMGKCSASAQVHHGRARNMNECFGAYGWEFTCEEMRWVTDWLLVRGVNLISPHAFYYSIRGPRRNERPPDVGPNNVWWDDYKVFADYCRRICWLLAEGRQVCRIAVLGTPTRLPWRAARILFEHQRDFNYLDTGTLAEKAKVSDEGISVEAMRYEVLVIDGAETLFPDTLGRLQPMIDAGRVLAYGEPIPGVPEVAGNPEQLTARLDALTPPDVRLTPPTLHARYHHIRHKGADFYFFTNEGPEAIDSALEVAVRGKAAWWDPERAEIMQSADPKRLELAPYTSRVLCVQG